MQPSILYVQKQPDGTYRTVFRNQHGRKLFLMFAESDGRIRILLCFYTDREYCISGEARYYTEPKKLKTREMPSDKLLEVIAAELDKEFAGIGYSTADTALPLDDYLLQYAVQPIRRYRFLVMAGSDDRRADELPDIVCTKLKNKLHRTVFLELGLYADGKGVVRSCYYCDRAYRQDDRRVTPPSLVSCFFPYTRQGILELVNRELICDFTHIIITGDIDPKHCNSPICGNI